MNIDKRFYHIAIIVSLTLSLTGCMGSSDSDTSSEDLPISLPAAYTIDLPVMTTDNGANAGVAAAETLFNSNVNSMITLIDAFDGTTAVKDGTAYHWTTVTNSVELILTATKVSDSVYNWTALATGTGDIGNVFAGAMGTVAYNSTQLMQGDVAVIAENSGNLTLNFNDETPWITAVWSKDANGNITASAADIGAYSYSITKNMNGTGEVSYQSNWGNNYYVSWENNGAHGSYVHQVNGDQVTDTW